MLPRLYWLFAGCAFVVISVGIGLVHAARWGSSEQAYLLKLAMIVIFTPIPLFPAAYCFSRCARLPGPKPEELPQPWKDPVDEATHYPLPWTR
jgi:hypothetical protein